MKRIKILQCSDPNLWYAEHVGTTFPLRGRDVTGLWTQEPAGYTNYVKHEDGEVIEMEDEAVAASASTDVREEHYTALAKEGAEPFQVLKAWLTPDEFRGYMKGSAIVYLARERLKGGDKDIEKAGHHLSRLLEGLK